MPPTTISITTQTILRFDTTSHIFGIVTWPTTLIYAKLKWLEWFGPKTWHATKSQDFLAVLAKTLR